VTGPRALGHALAATLSTPQGWLVGAAGFLVRGGILAFAVPVWALPSPVGVSILLGPFAIDASGFTQEFLARLIALAALAAVIVLAGAVVAAICEYDAWERGATTLPPARQGQGGMDGAGVARVDDRPILRHRRVSVVAGLVAIEIVALLPAAVAAWLTAGRLVEVGRVEYLLPSSLDVPYAVRVVNAARTEVAVLAACLIFAELVNAIASRRLLRRMMPPGNSRTAQTGPGVLDSPDHPGAERRGASRRILELAAGTQRIMGAWLGGWVVTAVTLLPGLLATVGTWNVLRAVYAAHDVRADPLDLVLSIGATLLFAAAWAAAVALAGAGSATRSMLWTAALARPAARLDAS
jgi:hypothetical protein